MVARRRTSSSAPATPPAAPSVQDVQTAAAKTRFLQEFTRTGNVSAAAKLADVGRRTHYDWLAQDPDYAAAFAEATEEAGDLLEAEARRRALEGSISYKFDRYGAPLKHPDHPELNYFERTYSDTLLIFLLKGAKPEKYAERRVLSGKGKGGALLLEAIVAGDDEDAQA